MWPPQRKPADICESHMRLAAYAAECVAEYVAECVAECVAEWGSECCRVCSRVCGRKLVDFVKVTSLIDLPYRTSMELTFLIFGKPRLRRAHG